MIIVELLLYFVILNVLLLITSYLSLKIVKNTIGKNIKEQFNKKLFKKVFWFTALSYVIGIIPLAFFGCHDFSSYLNNDSILIFIVLFPIYCIVAEPHYYDHAIQYLTIAVLSAFLASIIFNYHVVFKKLDLKKSKRFCAALIVSAMIAPYFYFVSFWGG